eukprot:superscaffoldBa00001675_g11573
MQMWQVECCSTSTSISQLISPAADCAAVPPGLLVLLSLERSDVPGINRVRTLSGVLQLMAQNNLASDVALGLHFIEAVDVWEVGCILAFFYLTENLFPVNYQMMKCMVEVLGQLEDHLLHAGKYTRYFFSGDEAAGSSKWRPMVVTRVLLCPR